MRPHHKVLANTRIFTEKLADLVTQNPAAGLAASVRVDRKKIKIHQCVTLDRVYRYSSASLHAYIERRVVLNGSKLERMSREN